MFIQHHHNNGHRRNYFFLSLWLKAMVPLEINLSSIRRIGYDEEQNEEAIIANLDFVEKSERTLRLSSSNIRRRWKDISIPRFARRISE